MASTDFKNIPGMSKEVREELIATFDALSNWRDEIETVNERCLNNVLDRISAVARAMGWPDQAVRSTREYLEGTAKVQTETIDQMIEGWKRQIKSTSAPMAIPRSIAEHIPGFGMKTEFKPLAPSIFWLQAAEMWQRPGCQRLDRLFSLSLGRR
jgi:hypothetical protein